MKRDLLEEIHESLLNGQRRQMVDQINEYGYDFFSDYAGYLTGLYGRVDARYSYFTDCAISYHRIMNR